MDKTNLTPARVFEQFAKINEIPQIGRAHV